MRISLQFEFEKDTSGRYGIAVIAVAPDGSVQGQPARIMDSVFQTPEEAADRLVSALRGAVRNPAPGAFGRHFLFPTPELAKHW
jgi:hypothetical protein